MRSSLHYPWLHAPDCISPHITIICRPHAMQDGVDVFSGQYIWYVSCDPRLVVKLHRHAWVRLRPTVSCNARMYWKVDRAWVTKMCQTTLEKLRVRLCLSNASQDHYFFACRRRQPKPIPKTSRVQLAGLIQIGMPYTKSERQFQDTQLGIP